MATLDPLKAFKKGFQGEAKHLKGKKSLSDYQNNYKAPELSELDESIRRSVLNR